jgi:hypothetical protein
VTPPSQDAQRGPAAKPAPQEGKPEPAPAAKTAEPRTPVAESRPPQPKPAPKPEARDQEPKVDASKSNEKKKDADEQAREEENRKQKP